MSGRIPLPEPCKVGEHVPSILHRTARPGVASPKVANVCGRCGRYIERQTEAGGPGDPWMTEDQYHSEMRLIREEDADDRDQYETGADRCPPRE